MKHIVFIVASVSLLTLFSCKKERCETVTVVRDCTGTYLRFNEKDYHVCNLEKVESFVSGAIVTATFRRIKECNGSAVNVIVCKMLHENEGWIEVEKIK